MATYEEQKELSNYIVRNCRDLFTPFERQVLDRIVLEGKRRSYGEDWWVSFREDFGAGNRSLTEDPELLAALADWSNLLQTICDRIVKERGEQILNRCPQCRAIRATPKAKYCVWCRYDERAGM